MGPHDGRVDHEVLVVRIAREDLEDPFPRASPGPAGGALVGALPVAVAFGQVAAPVRPAAQHPRYPVNESAVVFGRTASVCGFAGQQILDLLATGLRSTRTFWA